MSIKVVSSSIVVKMDDEPADEARDSGAIAVDDDEGEMFAIGRLKGELLDDRRHDRD